jgi:hypothetical protein
VGYGIIRKNEKYCFTKKMNNTKYTHNVNDIEVEKAVTDNLTVCYPQAIHYSSSHNDNDDNDDNEIPYFGTFDNYADMAMTYFNDMKDCEGWDIAQCQHLLAVDWEQTGRRLIAGGILKLKHFGDSFLHVYYL